MTLQYSFALKAHFSKRLLTHDAVIQKRNGNNKCQRMTTTNFNPSVKATVIKIQKTNKHITYIGKFE